MSKDKQEKGGKNAAKELKKALFYQKEHGCKRMSESELKKCDKFSEKYKAFLDAAKTEREANAYAIALLEKHAFTEYHTGMKPKAGDKIYRNNRDKAVLAARNMCRYAAFRRRIREEG